MFRICHFLSVVLFVVYFGSATSGTAQDELLTEAPDRYRIYGIVTDDGGNPVSGAKASLVILPHFLKVAGLLHEPAMTTSVQADQDGEFDIQVSGDDQIWDSVTQRTEILIVVQAKGYASMARKFDRERLLVDLPIKVKINKCEPLELKVLDQEGSPVEGVSVKATRISDKVVPFNCSLSKAMLTDGRGCVSLPDVASASEVYLSAAALGNHRAAVTKKEDEFVVQLPPAGTVKGKFELPDGEEVADLKGKKVFVATGDPYTLEQGSPRPMSWQVVELDQKGAFESDNLGYGQLQYILLDQNSTPYCNSSVFSAAKTLSAANTPMKVIQKLYRAQKFKIRFVNEANEPLKRLGFEPLGVHGDVDKEGVLTFKVAEGEQPSGQMFPYDPTGRYQVTDPFGVMVGRLEFENSEVKPIILTRSRSIRGRVVDEQGRPVHGAEVQYTVKSERFTLAQTVLANKSGDYRINGLAPNTSVKISAKKGNAATPDAEVTSVMSGSTEEVVIGIVPQPIAAIVGTIKNQSGKPVANAQVKLFKANVVQEEGFAAGSFSAVELLHGFEGVQTDSGGKFRYPETTLFNQRIQVTVSAPGYREFRYPFINGSRKELEDAEINLGEFELFKLPAKKQVSLSVRAADSGDPVSGAKLVFLGFDSGKQVATSDEKGMASLKVLDTGQLLAVKADGYKLHLQFVDRVSDVSDVSLIRESQQSGSLTWLDRPWNEFHRVAKELLGELEVPAPGESTYYRQSTFFAAQINADFPAFREIMSKPEAYQYQQYFLISNAGPIFLNAPDEAVEKLRSMTLPPEQKVSLLAQFALLSDDAELKEEIYGEAIVLLNECSGSKRQMSAGQLATNLVIDGNMDVAKELIFEEWSRADELREQLDSGKPKARIAESRVFVPLVAMLDPDAAIKLVRLTAIVQEAPGLLSQCVTYASIAGGHDVNAICKKHDIELNLNGLSRSLEATGPSRARYESTANWIRDHVGSMPDSMNKVAAIFFAARQTSDPVERSRLISLAVTARKECNVSYLWDDPAKEILEELPKFETFPAAGFDQLLFTSIEHAPDKTDTMQLNGVYGNLVKMIAIRNPEVARKLLDPAFENGAWLYGDPQWSAFQHDELLKAYAWIDPEQAAEQARELASEFAADDSVRKLQLLTKIITELNEIAIRKGMLQGR